MKRTITIVTVIFTIVLINISSVKAQTNNQQVEGVVNVNTATLEQLVLLPGIGPSRAQAIIESRARHRFTRVEQLTRIRGIGRKLIRRIRPYVVFEGETTLRTPIRLNRVNHSRRSSTDNPSTSTSH